MVQVEDLNELLTQFDIVVAVVVVVVQKCHNNFHYNKIYILNYRISDIII